MQAPHGLGALVRARELWGGNGKLGLTCLGRRDEGRVPFAVLPVDVNVGTLC